MNNLPSRRPARLAVVIAGLFALTAPFAAGIAAADQPDVFQGGEIVVTGTRTGGAVEQVGTVREVTAAEIQRMGARTLDEAIALLPGVNIRRGGDGTPRVDLRGLVTRHVKLFINGVPFNSTYDGQFDPTLIPVDAIARIKLTTGASSMLYGDGDIAGVIDIITKQGTGAAHLASAGIEGGTGGHYYAHADLSGATAKGNYYLGTSTTGHEWLPTPSGFSSPTAGTGHLTNSDEHRNNFYGNFGYLASDALSFNLTTTHTEGDNGLPPVDTTSKQDAYAPGIKYERLDNIIGNTLQLTADYAPGGAWSDKSWVYYNELSEDDNSYDNAWYDSMTDPTNKNTFAIHSHTRIPGVHTQASYDGGAAGTLSLAADARKEYWTDSGVAHDVQAGKVNGVMTYKNGTVADDRSLGVHSAALEYSVSPAARTHLSAGYSHYWQSRDNGLDETANGYLLGGAYDLDARTTLRASMSQHIRFPSAQQLFDPVSGNPNLVLETGRNLEAGIDHRLSARTRLGAVLFHDDVHNFINKDEVTNLYQNNAHYLFKGLELTAHTRPVEQLDLAASWTRLLADDLSPSAAFETLEYKPGNKVAVSASYDCAHGWQAYADAQYVSQQYYDSKKAPYSQAALGGYTLVDVKLTRHLSGTHTAVYVGANNLLDKAYETSYGFYQSGRVIYAGLQSAF